MCFCSLNGLPVCSPGGSNSSWEAVTTRASYAEGLKRALHPRMKPGSVPFRIAILSITALSRSESSLPASSERPQRVLGGYSSGTQRSTQRVLQGVRTYSHPLPIHGPTHRHKRSRSVHRRSRRRTRTRTGVRAHARTQASTRAAHAPTPTLVARICLVRQTEGLLVVPSSAR